MDCNNKNTLLHFSASRLGYATMSLPALATIFAVLWSLLFDFKGSTATHCKVDNYLPTISAAISREPQKYIWRIFISLHSAPRFMYLYSYYSWHTQIHVGSNHNWYLLLVKLAVSLHFIENMCLVLLTCVSSTENFQIHEKSFIVFVGVSMVYMLLTIYLVSWANKSTKQRNEKRDLISQKYKKIFAIVNIFSFSMAGYLYLRHNSYCEPLMYTYFAFFEYMTIFTNIGFHGTATIDMRDYSAGVVLTDLITKHR